MSNIVDWPGKTWSDGEGFCEHTASSQSSTLKQQPTKYRVLLTSVVPIVRLEDMAITGYCPFQKIPFH